MSTWAASSDLSSVATAAAVLVTGSSLALVIGEALSRRRRLDLSRTTPAGRLVLVITGVLAMGFVLGAVLRPVRITETGSVIGPRVVVLADASRSIDLPGSSGSRRRTLEHALVTLSERQAVRLSTYSFGVGPAKPWRGSATRENAQALSFDFDERPVLGSDLTSALEAIAHAEEERPSAIIVLSDGRLDRPSEVAPGDAVLAALGPLNVPVHVVPLASSAPPDASIRSVRTSGAAVAHQPFALTVEVGCGGGLRCAAVPVVARELGDNGRPVELARGMARVEGDQATVELTMTIERAGSRIVEIAIEPQLGDTIPENDRRFLSLNVGRDRVRVLHIAGRPTYDVRALRMWLKSDASLDVVAFFILRTRESRVGASPAELALIPFPVHQLFTEQLPTFDAVVLQDFDAAEYELTAHLPNLANYVRNGGGLIMVGGPGSFVSGHYAGTDLAEVLPVELDASPFSDASDVAAFTPRITEAGRRAPALAGLRALIEDSWPEMPGCNLVGDARPDASVLLTHPTRTTQRARPMPVLALGEYGSGRSIALTIDGSHRLLFSNFAAREAGRAHGAFWDGMLGWLMRDPRFEPATIDVPGGCIAGVKTTLAIRPLGGQVGQATLKIVRLGEGAVVRTMGATLDGSGRSLEFDAGKLAPGGYSAVLHLAAGSVTRRDFACEAGGDEWADSRPDPERLRAIANATGGAYLEVAKIRSLPLPPGTQVTAERHVSPVLPAWQWALLATVFLGSHWIVRRVDGLP